MPTITSSCEETPADSGNWKTTVYKDGEVFSQSNFKSAADGMKWIEQQKARINK